MSGINIALNQFDHLISKVFISNYIKLEQSTRKTNTECHVEVELFLRLPKETN